MSSSSHPAPWLVLKFGGTSVSSHPRWDEIGRLAMDRSNGARVLVVVSALSGITNALQAIATGAAEDAASIVASIIERHRALAAELGLDADAVLGERFTAPQRTPGRGDPIDEAEALGADEGPDRTVHTHRAGPAPPTSAPVTAATAGV